MYELKSSKYYRANPWDVSLDSRVAKLLYASSHGYKTVVYLYELADTSTFRYRAYNMCQCLDESDQWTGICFYGNELEILQRYLKNINVIVVIRFKWTFELDKLVKQAKKNKIAVAFDVDDLVYNVKYIPVISNSLAIPFKDEEDYKYWFHYISRINMAAELADCYISTNNYIAEHLKKDFSRECYLVPNFFNREQSEASHDMRNQKSKIKSDNKFTIGYFSGTPSHINDFLTVAPELRELLETEENIYLRIVGFMELPRYMDDFLQKGKIERVPLQNFIDLQKEIAQVDVNIIPLVNNEFTNCKSELKYFEASIVNTISVAAPTYVYSQIVNESNGFLCNEGQWYDTILNLYRNGISNDMIKNALDFSIDKYAYYNQLNLLEDVLDSIVIK